MCMEENMHCFQKLGLTQYESMALAALAAKNEATALDIAEKSCIPYTKIYSVLVSLEKQGFIKSSLERPKVYSALKPEVIFDLFIKKKENELEYFREKTAETLKAFAV